MHRSRTVAVATATVLALGAVLSSLTASAATGPAVGTAAGPDDQRWAVTSADGATPPIQVGDVGPGPATTPPDVARGATPDPVLPLDREAATTEPGTPAAAAPSAVPESGPETAPEAEPVLAAASSDRSEAPQLIRLGAAPGPSREAGSVPGGSRPTEPAPTDPSGSTPTEPVEPTPTEPEPTEPEPAPTEPAPTEPTPTEPVPAEPVTPAPDQIRWQGASLYKKTVVGAVVDLEVWSSTPAAMIELLLGGSVVATDTTIEQRPDHWLGTATVDLSGLPAGDASLTMRVTTPEGQVRSTAKQFKVDPVVAPLTQEMLRARPGPDNTGVPEGTVLTPSGSLRITVPGTVIDGLDVQGCVVVAANDVTIRNTRIRCYQTTRNRAVVMENKPTGLLIEDVEVDGGGTTEIGIDLNNATLRRLDIHHFNDGIRMGANLTIEDSWIHHMTRKGSLHPDAIQGISARNIIIRNNTLDPRNPDTGDLANAAIMLGSETGPKISQNVLIEGNYLDGGNYTINVSGSITAENMIIRGNRFGTSARYGPVISRLSVPVDTDNVLDVQGTRIRVVYIK